MNHIDTSLLRTTCTVAADKLTSMLEKEHIPYEICSLFDGYKITFPTVPDGDIICHEYSYGGKDGLWESMGFPWDGGDVTGGLSAEAFVEMFKEEYPNNTL